MYLKFVNEHDKAINDLSAAIKIDPKDAHAYSFRGELYLKKGMFQNAVDDYTAAIKIEPDVSFHYRRRAEAYRAIGKASLAESDDKKADEIERLQDEEN
jgi:Tfp pilus assembly protein PilF